MESGDSTLLFFFKTIKYIILCKLKNQLKELYGIQSSGWSMLHERFNRYVFCEANRKSLIAEYLMWEEFVEDAKKLGGSLLLWD